jgi:hypothetical protein
MLIHHGKAVRLGQLELAFNDFKLSHFNGPGASDFACRAMSHAAAT